MIRDDEPELGESESTDQLDPREAAVLLDDTRRQAQRQFDIRPPALTLAAGVTVLLGYGAVWLSVRNEHPYSGPSGWALAVLYGLLALWIVFVSTVLRRALRGRSSRQRGLDGIVFGAIWICVYVFQYALYVVVPTRAIAYGVYAAVGPLIIVGAGAAGYEAARGKRVEAAFAVAAVILGSLASFAGPDNVWGVVGVGGFGLLLVGAAAQLWERHQRDRG
jgi:hypothetical protein